MAQHDYNIANQTFPNTRSDINDALSAVASNNSGTAAPSTTFANQWFYETDTNLLQIRNEDNDAYITIAELDQTNDTVEYFKADSIRTALIEFTDGDDAMTIADGGAVTFSQAPVFPDGSIAIADLDIDGATDIGADIVDADLFIIDDGAGGSNRKVAASRLKTYAGANFDGAITINESGADVDFRVESNSNANMLLVDGGNNAVSIGSSFSSSYPDSGSDGLQVHGKQLVVSNYSAGATGSTMNFVKSRGTSAGAAAGTAINSNDVIAAMVAYGDDSNSFEVAGKLQFMAGADWSNGDCAGQFELYLTPDGSTTTDLKIRMLNDGRMGIGVYPEASGDNRGLPVSGRLHVTEDFSGYQVIYAGTTAGSGNVFGIHIAHFGQDPDNNTSRFYGGAGSSGNRFLVFSDGDVVNHDNSYGSISDERIKQDIVDCNEQWDDIKALKIRNYKKKDDVEKYGDKAWVQLGVIAQELEESGMDKCVKQETFYSEEDYEVTQGKANVGDIKEYKAVKYSIVYMKAIKALQEAMKRIEVLESKIN